MNEINWSEIYEGGKCPDCEEKIPTNTKDGEACQNCDHVFWKFRAIEMA